MVPMLVGVDNHLGSNILPRTCTALSAIDVVLVPALLLNLMNALLVKYTHRVDGAEGWKHADNEALTDCKTPFLPPHCFIYSVPRPSVKVAITACTGTRGQTMPKTPVGWTNVKMS